MHPLTIIHNRFRSVCPRPQNLHLKLGYSPRVMQKAQFSLSWFAPILWIALAFGASHGFLHFNRTRASITEAKVWVERFQNDFHRLPTHLAEVRALARSYKTPIVPYDSYGMRLQYVALTDTDYLIKSFGRDEQENHLNTAVDPTFSTLSSQAETFVQAENFQESVPQFYQAALLDGSQSPESGLIASLQLQVKLKNRQLLVRSPKSPDFFMIAFHDRVEEFLWLPGGQELIFSATGSDRYEDGLFYWNLKDNSIHNLLPDLKKQFWPELPDDSHFFIALSHISQEPALIYILLTAAESEELNPKMFYSFKNLIALPIGQGLESKVTAQRIQTDLAFTAFDYTFSQERLLKTAEMASPVQQEWLALSLEGDTEELISQWQDFSSNHAENPMCVYGLWWLSSVYNDAFRQLSQRGSPEAHAIRNFGIEISEALASMPTAPEYLRAMGRFLKKNLLLSRAADYNVTSLPETP